MSDIVTFSFENIDFRAVDQNGEFWFLGIDVCKALGISNHRDAIRRLADDEKNTVAIADGIPGNPNRTIINEPGVYRLIFTSRVEGAEKFKRWLAHEVLPAIRKTGRYDMANGNENSIREEELATREAELNSRENAIRNEEVKIWKSWHEINKAVLDEVNTLIHKKNEVTDLRKATVRGLITHSTLSNKEICNLVNGFGFARLRTPECVPEIVAYHRRMIAEEAKRGDDGKTPTSH